ncbi:MAG: indole-3-glycerol phosphate synthase TrpC [Chitinophagaceae bacterium]
MNILDQIIAYKKVQVKNQKSKKKIVELEQSKFFSRHTFSLKKNLMNENKTGVIAEFKRKSPSKGIINNYADVIEITNAYKKYGASALSILTDEKFFEGNENDLIQARINSVPILRKDFIVDEYQVIESKSIGADVILLIAACLTKKQVQQFAALAKKLGLEVLLEIHSQQEFEHICDKVDFIGINNRNLKTFEVAINTSFNLIKKIPKEKIVISESGISNIDTIIKLKQAGFKGFLIGEYFMKQVNPAIAFQKFVEELKAKENAH